MQRGFLPPAALDSLHDLIAFLPAVKHFDQGLRRVLQIAVHHRDAVSLRLGQAGHDGGFLSEIPGKTDSDDPGILRGQRGDFAPGVIRGAVVDKDQLEVHPLRLKHLPDVLRGAINILFLVIGRQNN